MPPALNSKGHGDLNGVGECEGSKYVCTCFHLESPMFLFLFFYFFPLNFCVLLQVPVIHEDVWKCLNLRNGTIVRKPPLFTPLSYLRKDETGNTALQVAFGNIDTLI